jgi:hypothetical protein
MISVGCEHGHSFCNNQQVSENLQQRGGQHGSKTVYYDRRYTATHVVISITYSIQQY